MDYNLLEERWIPVLMKDGKYCRVGIKDALTQAGRIRQIAATNPMDRVAILWSQNLKRHIPVSGRCDYGPSQASLFLRHNEAS